MGERGFPDFFLKGCKSNRKFHRRKTRNDIYCRRKTLFTLFFKKKKPCINSE